MSFLVAVRERIQSFYGQFAGILSICGKFLLAVFVFLIINREIGYNPLFSNIFVILIMALIAAILSTRMLVFLACIVILGNAYSIGLEVMLLTAFLMLLLLIMFVSFVPDDAIETVLMPIGMAAGVPALIPICCGLKRNPGCIAALWPGIIIHYYLGILGENAAAIQALETKQFLDRLKIVTDALLSDRLIVMNMFAAAAVVIIVYAIRKLQADYAYEISVLAGGVMYVVMMVISRMTLEIEMDMPRMLIGALIAVIFAYVFLFFVHHVDYQKVERLTFEDDDYFYYVKAVPKVVSDEWEEEEEDDDEPDAPVVEQAALYTALQEAAKDVSIPSGEEAAAEQEQ